MNLFLRQTLYPGSEELPDTFHPLPVAGSGRDPAGGTVLHWPGLPAAHGGARLCLPLQHTAHQAGLQPASQVQAARRVLTPLINLTYVSTASG